MDKIPKDKKCYIDEHSIISQSFKLSKISSVIYFPVDQNMLL